MQSVSQFNRLLPAIIALFSYASVLAKGARVLDDPDPYWHVVVGRWILAHGAVPNRDVFSATVAGTPWVPHEWLAEVAIAWLYDHFGWTALVIATGIAFATALALLTIALRRYLPPAATIVGAATAWGLCFPHVLARPHVLALPLLVLWADRLVAAREHDRAPSLLLAPLMLLWANLHGSFIFGVALVALFAGEALFMAADRHAALRVVRTWGLFGIAAFACALVTPHGIGGLLMPFGLTSMQLAMSLINEWKSADFQEPQPLEAWLLLALLGVLLYGVRLPVTRIAMLLLLLHLALQHQRHQEILGLLVPLLVAPALAPRLRAAGFALPPRLAALAAPLATGTLAAALVIAGGATWWRRDLAHDRSRFTPAQAVAAVAENRIEGAVLNDFNFGGYLIFSGIAPFIDGRVEVYGDAFLRRYSNLDQLPALLSEYQIAWTLFVPGTARVALMDALPGWRRLHSDPVAVVHVRSPTVEPAH